MADKISKKERSDVMRKIKASDTAPEIILRKSLWNEGKIGYRINVKSLPGKPDVVYTKKKVAIFVDGCFWHGCPICYRRPKSNRKYWDKKLKNNMARDVLHTEELQAMGWKVIRFWEHEVRENVHLCVRRISSELSKGTF